MLSNAWLRYGILVLLISMMVIQGALAALDAEGLWSRRVGLVYRDSLTVSSSGQYVATVEMRPLSEIRSLYMQDREGRMRWNYSSDVIFSPFDVSPDGSYICASYGGGIALFGRSGTMLWNVTLWSIGKGSVEAASVWEDGTCLVLAQKTVLEKSPTYAFLRFNDRGQLLGNHSLIGSFEAPTTVSISPDGNYLALATYPIYLFNGEGQNIWSVNPKGGSIDTVFVSSGGSYVIAGSGENEIFLYNKQGDLLWKTKVGGPILKVSISPDNNYAVAGSRDGYIYYYNLDGSLKQKKQYAEQYGTYPLSFSQDGNYVASAIPVSNVTLRSTTTGSVLFNRRVISGFPTVEDPAIAYKGEYSASWSDRTIYFFNKKGELLWQQNVDESIYGLLIASTGRYLAARSERKVYLFSREGQRVWTFETPSRYGHVYAISISTDGDYVAVGADKLHFLNNKGELLWTYDTNGTVSALSPFSSDGKYFVAGSYGQYPFAKTYLFNREGMALWSHDVYARVCYLSADGNYMSIGSSRGLYLYDKIGKLLWNREVGSVEAVASTVDGRYISAVAGSTLCFFNNEGNILWNKTKVSLPFSFSCDKASTVVNLVGNRTTIDKDGNEIRAGHGFISSDGDYEASTESETRLFFQHMKEGTATQSTSSDTKKSVAPDLPQTMPTTSIA